MNLHLNCIQMDRYPSEWWDRAIEVLLIALLTLCPLALGAVHAWSEEIVIILAGAMGLTFLLKLLVFPTTSFMWTRAYVPVVCFLLIAIVQLFPLPDAWVARVSPHTNTLKTELLGDLPHADEVLSTMTLSFYPRATKHDLRLVLAAAIVFLVVTNVYREPASIKRLLRAIAVIGGGIAVLALVQDVAGNGKIYWLVPTYAKSRAYSGPFINHSHYGQFMNLSVGAALGLLLVVLQEAFAERRITPARVARYLASPAGKTVKLLLAMLVLAAATIFLSLSRGAMISMLIAGAFTALVLSAQRSLQGRGWIIMLMALGAFVCVLYIGFEGVYDRLATLGDPGEASSGRWQIVKDIALAWTKFPLLGVGLGTHEVVYPMFNRSTTPALAMHAENEYAQAAEETGILGLLALVVFGAMVATSYVRSVKAASVPIHAATYGLGFGLLAVLIHSLSDFGQHLPANAMLSVTCCGLLVTLDRMRPGASRWVPRPADGLTSRVLRLAAFTVMAGIFIWALWGSERARVAEAHWKRVLAAEHHLQADRWQGSDQAFEYLFFHAEAAAAAEPDNIQYRHWLGTYKWLSLVPYIDPNTGELPPATLAWAREIVGDLHQVRPLCPTFGPTCCVVGEIEKFVLGDPNGAERIRQGYRLAPCDPIACLAVARIDAEAGDVESAFGKISRAVQLDRSRFWQATSFCMDTLARPDLALLLAGDNVEWLGHVANKLAASGGQGQLADTARAKVLERLEQKAREPGASARILVSLANLYGQRGDVELGIDRYRLALRKDYEQVSVHLELARLLKRAGRTGEALHEAQICLRLSPDLAPARKLVEELSVLPDAAGQPSGMGQ